MSHKQLNYNGFIITLYTNEQSSKGLGDWVAKWLRRIGIKQFKLCGCARRQKRLNELGWKWQKFFAFKH